MAEEMNQARIEISTEKDFKCSRCGGMFPVEGEGTAAGTAAVTAEASGHCPFCGYDCSDGTCRIITGSKEGF